MVQDKVMYSEWNERHNEVFRVRKNERETFREITITNKISAFFYIKAFFYISVAIGQIMIKHSFCIIYGPYLIDLFMLRSHEIMMS